ncbi:MAG: glycosyltransferase [Planctomycetes bacterium]|nr:glycosyltransferase [Planctomycetota bacterium]
MIDAGGPSISVVVPAFDEGPHVREHLRRIVDAVAHLRRPFEVVLVDDGSRDATAAEAEAVAAADARVRVVRHAQNRGKGAALATGCAAARHDVLVFLDADLEIAPESVGPLLEAMERAGAAVAVGSKYVPGAVERRPAHRVWLSRLYLAVTSVLFRLPIRDTQTGLKALRRDVAAQLVPALSTRRFAWDVELLVLAHRARLRLVAVPVTVDFRRPGVRIGWRGFLASGVDTARVFLRDRGLARYGRAVARARGVRRGERAGPRVVLTGDDLGLAPAGDRGLLDAVRDGGLTTVSVLADGTTAASAARTLLASRADVDVGVHLDLAPGRLLPFLLRAAAGLVPGRAVREAVRAAVGRVRALGLSPTHVDAHRHAFLVPTVYRAVALEARRLGLVGIRRPAPCGALRCGPGAVGRLKGAVLAAAAALARGTDVATGLASPAGIVDAEVVAGWVRRGRWPRRLAHATVEVVAHPADGPWDGPRADGGLDREADARHLRTIRDGLARLGVTTTTFAALPRARRTPPRRDRWTSTDSRPS